MGYYTNGQFLEQHVITTKDNDWRKEETKVCALSQVFDGIPLPISFTLTAIIPSVRPHAGLCQFRRTTLGGASDGRRRGCNNFNLAWCALAHTNCLNWQMAAR